MVNLPDPNLASFPGGTDHFDEYVEAVGWATDDARTDRGRMMELGLEALGAAASYIAWRSSELSTAASTEPRSTATDSSPSQL